MPEAGQTVFAESAALKFSHEERSDAKGEQGDRFRPAHQERRDRIVALVPVLLPKALNPACADQNETSKQNAEQSEEQEQPPARAQAVGSRKNLFRAKAETGTGRAFRWVKRARFWRL